MFRRPAPDPAASVRIKPPPGQKAIREQRSRSLRLRPQDQTVLRPAARPLRGPSLITPELQRLRDAVAEDDPDHGWDELRAVTDQVDSPQQRARLADAILRLRAQRRLTRTQAAYAIYHIDTRSQHLLAASVTHAVAVAVGASRTPRRPQNRRLTRHSSSGSSGSR
jgi:hypothetical protein